MATAGPFYAHTPMLLGVVPVVAGISSAIGHAGQPLATGPAAALTVSVLLCLAGGLPFRRTLGLSSGIVRDVAAVMARGAIRPAGRSEELPLVPLVVLLAEVFL